MVRMKFGEKNFNLIITEDTYDLTIYYQDLCYMYQYNNGILMKQVQEQNEMYQTSSCKMKEEQTIHYTVGDEKNLDRVLNLIKDNIKDTLFYTGAGVSRESGIITFSELFLKWKLDCPEEFIKTIDAEPDALLKVFREFIRLFKIAKPNRNHYLLRNIVREHGGTIVTENLDMLHELSGVKPIKPLKGGILEDKDYKVIVFLGVSNIQCEELIKKIATGCNEIYLISFHPLIGNPMIHYTYYNMDVYDFLDKLNTVLLE